MVDLGYIYAIFVNIERLFSIRIIGHVNNVMVSLFNLIYIVHKK